METETIASRNVVELLLQDVFKSSICPAQSPAEDDGVVPRLKEDFVQGFDCRFGE